ncbi:hypothetical protein [Kocuria rosea]|uniref:hypothetical protein n=1 Tax=Kocuria rosea TaxID=1275 RepID=UPI00203D30FE|nr:hypothetical protein [Kocuria rosea]MCM3687848.1 hypothetical protein [Kocuria rosea]
MHLLAVSMGVSASAEAAQTTLQGWGRLLLMFAMVLFLSYMLFILGAVLLSAGADRAKGLGQRIRQRRSVTLASTLRPGQAGGAQPAGDMQDAWA